MKIVGLFTYPIKSCAGHSFNNINFGPEGLVGDRQFMLVDSAGKFISQRTHPFMSQVKVSIGDDLIQLNSPRGEARGGLTEGQAFSAVIWKENVTVSEVCREVSEVLSVWLETNCKLVRLEEKRIRKKDDDPFSLAFADGYPFLLTSNKSLSKLSPEGLIPMDRFRANIVIDGEIPFAEDGASRVKIGDHEFTNRKKCIRCKIINTDQKSSVVNPQPLKELMAVKGEPAFGINLTTKESGKLFLGDTVEFY